MCKSCKTPAQTTKIQYMKRQYRYRHPVNIIPLRGINTNGDLGTNAHRFRITFPTRKNGIRARRIYNRKGRMRIVRVRGKANFARNNSNSIRRGTGPETRWAEFAPSKSEGRPSLGLGSFYIFFFHLSTFPEQNEL